MHLQPKHQQLNLNPTRLMGLVSAVAHIGYLIYAKKKSTIDFIISIGDDFL
jgi:hypothetical protein